MSIDVITRRNDIAKAQDECFAYRNRDRDLALRKLLDALIIDYQFELINVSKDGLERKQGAVLQLIALRQFIDDPTKNTNLKI